MQILNFILIVLGPFYKTKNLHMTDIRNEAAYFSCISQV